MKKILFLLAIVGVLFISSGQTYEQQSLVPSLHKWLPGKPFEGLLSTLQIPYWGKIISVEERGYYYFVEFLLRKSAHFFIFGLLAIAVYSVLPKMRLRSVFALGITFLLAIADEYHQSLTGGRTPTINDVYLDMSGAITFIVFLHIIQLTREKIKKRRQSEIHKNHT
ncbi:VanZ family protein [Sporosarcina sp. OR05]|uniref:VanZ family protein n=1 Tax=Sporosarcina sp. OR05 TaxID=2969819 RepID=UPI00352AC2CA